MPTPAEETYVNALMNYLDALQGFIFEYEVALGDEQNPGFDFNSEPVSVAARVAYIASFAAALSEIEALQRAGIAHYQPAYLEGAQTLLNQVQAGYADDYNGALSMMPSINNYGNLYNDGTFNWHAYLRQREIGNARIRFISAVPSVFGAPSYVQVGYYNGSDPKSVTVFCRPLMLLSDFKNAFLTAISYTANSSQVVAWSPSGMEMTPDSKALKDFNIATNANLNIDYPGGTPKFG